MITIFLYDNYRQFLKDYFEQKKTVNNKYSLTYYSRLIELSDSYLKQVLAGRRSLNLEKAKVLASKLKLKPLESSYFLTLIMMENAKTEDLHEYFKNVLLNLKQFGDLDYSGKEHKKNIFSNSLAWEIYTLLGVGKIDYGLDSVSKILTNKRATKTKVTEVIERLKNSKAIIMEEGQYKTKNVILEHSDEVRDIYRIALERAAEYLQTNHKNIEEEYFDSFCISIGEKEFLQIKKLLDETKVKMAEIVKKTDLKNMICYYNANLFSASRKF